MPATPQPPAHAPEIRLGLVGGLGTQNVWALFAGQDYSYNNYAVRASYWPRLYTAGVPDQAFRPNAAEGMPGEVSQEGAFHAASIPLRDGLHWSDGTPLTADDVAFTVNTALKFDLGFDWGDYYDAAYLDHAEATAPDTVKFFFTKAPDAGAWQYGALQGPIVNEGFWGPKVAAAASSLPGEEQYAEIKKIRARITTFQDEVNRLYAALIPAQGEGARQLQADLRRQQGNLDEAMNDLTKAEGAIKDGLIAARRLLYDQSAAGEPLLGAWMPAEADATVPAGAAAVNVPGRDLVSPAPNFDAAVYFLYKNSEAAAQALSEGEINVVLDPAATAQGQGTGSMTSPTRSLRTLLFNPGSPDLAGEAARRALACMIDQEALAASLGAQGASLTSFIPQGEDGWNDLEARLPCADQSAESRLEESAKILRDAGYTWQQAPSSGMAAQGLKRPDGSEVARLTLLVDEADATRTAAAAYVEQQGLLLGLPISKQEVPRDAVDYAVFTSGEYDLAVIGWRVGPYPGYLCDWFGPAGELSYASTPLTSQCGEFAVASDLGRAQTLAHEIQQTLAQEVPMVPLYSSTVEETFQGITYPFESLLGGLAGAYGAPEWAAPAAP